MRLLALILIMTVGLAMRAQAEDQPTISQGERIDLPEVGFSITPPTGWLVNRNSHGSSLMFEVPKQANQIYQPTIQVMVFSNPRYIDEVTKKEYGDLIVEKFGKVSNRVTGYHLRSEEFVQMETGDPAILYYTEFQYDDVAIMQMHILISSASNHFLMSYTDLAKTFEDENAQGLAVAYSSMHSAQLATRPPWRYQLFAIIGLVLLTIVVAWFVLRWIRGNRMDRLGQRIEDEDHKEIHDDQESQFYSRHSTTTDAGLEHDHDEEEWKQEAPKAKASAAQKGPKRPAKTMQSSHFEDDDDEADVSDVIPLSTLEKSLHPGRKRGKEQSDAAAVEPQNLLPNPPPLPTSAPAVPVAPAPIAAAPKPVLPSAVPTPLAPPPLPGPASTPTASAPPIPAAFQDPSPPPIPAGIAAPELKPVSSSKRSGPVMPPEMQGMNSPTRALQQPTSQNIEDRDPPDMTEEARLSEILPRAGTIEKSKPKRKGFLWRKKSEDNDDHDDKTEHEDDDSSKEEDKWAAPSSKKSSSRKLVEEDEDKEVQDQWAVEPTKKSTPGKAIPKSEHHEDAEEEGETWAPEATKRSNPKNNSLLNETQGPRRLMGRAGPLPAVTKGDTTQVTEDGWNLNKSPKSDHEDDEEEDAG